MNQAKRKKSIVRRAVLYTVITTATITIALFLGLYTFGFRFDMSLNKVEQTGLVQFGSSPSGAISRVDGNAVQFRTPNKTVVNAGRHDFSMERDKYHDWNKTLTIKPGMLRWLNYAILVPKEIETTPLSTYETMDGFSVSPEKKDLMIQPSESAPSFELVDIRGNEIKTKTLNLAPEVYSQATIEGVIHKFIMMEWDEGGRYMLLKHQFEDSSEWIILDTQNVAASKNLTTHFELPMSSVKFSDTSGNKFYVLNNSEIRKLDLSSSTISRPIVSRVESFVLYDKNHIAYVGQSGDAEVTRRIVGVYRDGDVNSHIVKSFSVDQPDIKVAITKYFNEDYVAILGGNILSLYKGNFPSDGGNGVGLKNAMTLNLDFTPYEMSFGETGQYLMMRRGGSFVSYDLEYQSVAKFAVEVSEDGVFSSGWLNGTHIWINQNGAASIREFDGKNTHEVVQVTENDYPVVLTSSKKYIYSIGRSAENMLALQRSLMILR